MSTSNSTKSVREIISASLRGLLALTESKVVVTVLWRVSHRQMERWEPVRVRKESMGLAAVHMVLEEGLSQNS